MDYTQFEGHTPGDWVKDGYTVSDSRGSTIIECDSYRPTEEDYANARLIAAAPALLADNAQLRAEVERLRGALEIIDANAAESATWIRRHARAALGKGAT